MPHLRLEVAEEWLREDFKTATGFDAKKLLEKQAATTPEVGKQRRHVNIGIRLVDHIDVDVDVGTQDLPLGAILRNPIHGR